jgi:hypothetical protein
MRHEEGYRRRFKTNGATDRLLFMSRGFPGPGLVPNPAKLRHVKNIAWLGLSTSQEAHVGLGP